MGMIYWSKLHERKKKDLALQENYKSSFDIKNF